ncbi:MAG: hypothetical protein CML68_20185 [Rhodobacteraceae bacterium]|nr:hypothetical protein [Paracoccaceae bacterium]
MTLRSSRTEVTFCRPFTLSGYPDELPAGSYELLIEEELIQEISFAAYRRTALFLMVRRVGRTELRPITDADLDMAGVSLGETGTLT